MEHIRYKPQGAKRKEGNTTKMKYFLFTYAFITFLFGLVLMAIGIWLGVDRNFMTTIVGNNSYAAAVFLVLASGCLIFFVSFCGCCGVVREEKPFVFVYLIILTIISVLLLIGGILAITFKAQIGDKVKETMSKTLVDYYGVNFQNEYNRAVTDAWDKAQERLKCCGVTKEGWYLYRQSNWFKSFGSQSDREIVYEEDEMRPYVPLSCCVKDASWHYINQQVCQRWRLGPPGSPVVGAINRAVYYNGCFDAGYEYLSANSVVLIGLGIAIGLYLVLGIVLSILLLIKLV